MARPKANTHKDLKLLVQRVTGFEENDENFPLCMSFAESNFKYHRFLSPDSHKVEKAVTGLCEKLQVHSQGDKALVLRQSADQFLNTTGLEGRDHGKTDTHYAMLSFLLELSESPTNADFTVVSDPPPMAEDEDDFDWKAYLLDPEDVNFMSFGLSDTSSEEDLSSSDTEGGEDREDVNCADSRLSPTLDASQADLNRLSLNQPGPSSAAVTTGLPTDQADEWSQLASAVVVQYWLGKEEVTSGHHATSNLIRDWTDYQRQMNELYSPPAQLHVTETQIIREALWMLSGVKDHFIFKFSGGHYHLNPDVYVSHLTTQALESSLQVLMQKASQLQALLTFVEEVTTGHWQGQGSAVPQTYQAFAQCLTTFTADFGQRLVAMEKEIISQEKSVTVECVKKDLRPWLAQIQAIHGVYVSGVTSLPSHCEATNCSKAGLLLNTLYRAVVEQDLVLGMGEASSVCCLLLEMLIKCSEPLLRITSDWINHGQLLDPAGEFILHRNAEIRSLDETFWEKAFVSNVTSAKDQSSTLNADDSDPARTSTAATKAKPGSEPAAADPRMNDSVAAVLASLESSGSNLSPSCEGRQGVPLFLRPILGQAVLTGKSMEMLETLGSLAGAKGDAPVSLYDHLITQLTHKCTGLKAKLSHRGDSCSSKIDTSSSHVNLDRQMDKLGAIRGHKDLLLRMNMENIFPTDKVAERKKKQCRNEFRVEMGQTGSLSQVLRVCQSCLVPYAQSRYLTVCSHLLDTLKTDYKLMEHILAMQRYFLMSAGQVMHDFYTAIFNKVVAKELWKDESVLTMYLHEAVDPVYPVDSARLSVSVQPVQTPPSDQQAIGVTDCIRLRYLVPWPVDVVISEATQKLYSDIFSFLLQIKRSRFSLVQLWFEELSRPQQVPGSSAWASEDEGESMSRETRVHRFQLLRFRLLDFVNSLHNYIMTRILHSIGLEFEPQMASATDLEQVIVLHGQYVGAVHDRCLLHPRLDVLRKAVVRVLNLCLACSGQWALGVDFISGKVVEEMEQELTRCVHFLSSFLSNVIKRGSFPHLESLAFALASSLQHTQRPAS